jgi:hypothetical protein
MSEVACPAAAAMVAGRAVMTVITGPARGVRYGLVDYSVMPASFISFQVFIVPTLNPWAFCFGGTCKTRDSVICKDITGYRKMVSDIISSALNGKVPTPILTYNELVHVCSEPTIFMANGHKDAS